MKSAISRLLMVFSAMIFVGTAYGVIDSYEFSSPEQEQQFFELTNELRCPKCQNQSIADSNAPIAQDLRREVHRLVNDGADNQTVIDFMLARYGDFVLYKPRLSGMNLILWLGPVLLLFVGFMVLFVVVRQHRATLVENADNDQNENQPFDEAALDKKLNSLLAGAFDKQSVEDNKTGGKE